MISINGKELTPTVFPDQTSQVWKLEPSLLLQTFVMVEWNFSHEGEFMQLAQLKALLAHHNIQAALHMPYLPYARQDKEISNTATFGLYIFADFLNLLGFKEVTCVDAHSEVAGDLIKNFISYPPLVQIENAFKLSGANVLCFPDHGAAAKYGKIGLSPISAIVGHKKRDPITGNITEFSIAGNPAGTRILIVDDIIDGGLTFVKLAELLFQGGAESVDVYATHGIFSKGVDILYKAGIGSVFTKDGVIFIARDSQHTIKKWGDLP